jgi:hypothetical protein
MPNGIAMAAARIKPTATLVKVVIVSINISFEAVSAIKDVKTSSGEGKMYSGMMCKDVNNDQIIRINNGSKSTFIIFCMVNSSIKHL